MEPLFPSAEKDIKSSTETGTERRNAMFYQKQIQFRGYFNTTTKNNLALYLSLANKTTINYNGQDYVLTQAVDVEPSQIGYECWLIEFVGKLSNEEYYYYI